MSHLNKCWPGLIFCRLFGLRYSPYFFSIQHIGFFLNIISCSFTHSGDPLYVGMDITIASFNAISISEVNMASHFFSFRYIQFPAGLIFLSFFLFFHGSIRSPYGWVQYDYTLTLCLNQFWSHHHFSLHDAFICIIIHSTIKTARSKSGRNRKLLVLSL